MRKTFIILLSLGLTIFEKSQSQTVITVKESLEIKYRAEELIKTELRDLFNIIANSDVGESEIKEVIERSYKGPTNKVFNSSEVIIEYDINPSSRNASSTRDVAVDNYLRDLDLLYPKSTGTAVVFSNVRVSNVKEADRLYVKVYFNSFFKNASPRSDTPYAVTNRVAELNVKKDGSRWKPYIASISFFDPGDTASENLHDVLLSYDGPSFGPDTAAMVKKVEDEVKAAKEKEDREKYQKELKLFNELLTKGDEARRILDFTEALKYYNDAKELWPYDPLPFSRINQLNKDKMNAEKSAAVLYNDYRRIAESKALNRQYEEAIDYYNKANKLNVAGASDHKKEIAELTVKFRNIEELELRYKAGQYKQTIDGYDALIKKDKTNSDYYLGRARAHEAVGDNKRAFRDYEQALLLDRSNLMALANRAELYKKTNEPFKAATDYKDLILKDKLNTPVYIKLVDILLQINANNISDALKYLDDAISLPENQRAPELYLKRGLLLAEKKDFKNADNNFTSVLRLDSTHAFGYYNRGKCQLVFQNVMNAASDFEKARRYHLDSQYLKVIEDFADNFYGRSLAKQDASKDSAMTLIDYAIAVNPFNATYQLTKGTYYSRQKKYPEAIQCFDRAVNLYEGYIDAYYERGLAYYLLANYPSAIESWKRAVALNPQLYSAHKGLAESYFAMKDYINSSLNGELAIKTINSLKSQPNSSLVAEVYNVLGKSYFHMSDFEKSIAALKNALRKDPAFAEAYFNRGLSYHKKFELGDAITDLSKAVSLNSKQPIWYYSLAKALQDKKDYFNAAVNYGTALNMDSTSILADALYLRGFCNYQIQNYPAALSDYLKYVTINSEPSANNFDLELGNIYLHIGKYDSAYQYYNKIYTKDSNNGFAMYGIASALTLKGSLDEALAWFEKTFKLKTIPQSEIRKDKLLASIKEDKRFKALMKKYY